MGLNLKKRTVVGVSVTPGIGLEVAHIDYERHILLNYVSKPFACDSKLNGNFDLDIFKETLYDALVEVGAPQGTGIILNIPASIFEVRDWPASIDKAQLGNNIEDEIYENPIFKDSPEEPVYSYSLLPNSTIQFTKLVYTAAQKSLIVEIALQIKDLKYKLMAIDTSVNSTLNALLYSGRVDVAPTVSWVMLLVENSCCRVVLMQGRSYVDYYEEKVNIGEVLEDAENYDSVISAVSPILNKVPSSFLYVVSKTNVISAEVLASKLSYKSQIVHQEANIYNKSPLIDIAFDMDAEKCRLASLDVIGAAIKRDFGQNSIAPLNLFNKTLGDVYLSQVPPTVNGVELSLENMLKLGIPLMVIILGIAFLATSFVNKTKSDKENRIKELDKEIASINKYLKDHSDISSKQFSELDEIRIGLSENKNVYSYYTIVGTEIPKKLWLTGLRFGDQVTIEGQADNLESVYGFFRNIKDYNPSSGIKLQKLGLAGNSRGYSELNGDTFDTDSVMNSLNADYYEFKISDVSELKASENNSDSENDNNKSKSKSKSKNRKDTNIKTNPLPALEPLE